MIILNTTFALDPAIEGEFIHWLRNSFIPQALQHGFDTPLLSKIVSEEPEADTISVALQLTASDHQLIDRWFEGAFAGLYSHIRTVWPNRAFPFTTRLQQLSTEI